VFNATFNNISAISWQSVLLEEEAKVPGENHQPATCHWQPLNNYSINFIKYFFTEHREKIIGIFRQTHTNVIGSNYCTY